MVGTLNRCVIVSAEVRGKGVKQQDDWPKLLVDVNRSIILCANQSLENITTSKDQIASRVSLIFPVVL